MATGFCTRIVTGRVLCKGIEMAIAESDKAAPSEVVPPQLEMENGTGIEKKKQLRTERLRSLEPLLKGGISQLLSRGTPAALCVGRQAPGEQLALSFAGRKGFLQKERVGSYAKFRDYISAVPRDVKRFEAREGAQYTLIVGRGPALSGSEPVTIAAAQPAVFLVDASADPKTP